MTSSNAPTNSTVIAFPKVLREAGGYVILELRREWKRELEVVEAQSREVISQLRAENAELRGLSREFLSAYKTEVAEIRATIEQQVNKRLAELKDGIDGKEGKEGSTGPQGPQGEKGERGEAGEIGERGAQGEKGERGEQGSQGAQGEKGEKGIDGTTGATGDRGEPGETGPAGPPGEPGSAGAPGAPGRPGTIGPIGPIGKTAELDYALLSKALEVEVATALASWPRPENGIDGKDGRDGIDGAIGAQGERGPQGQAGEQGPPGRLPLVKGWTDEIHYKGDVVVDGGGTYQALRDTAKRPGHDDWVCLAAPGRDGEDGRSPKSFKVCGTYDAEEKYHALDIVTLNSTWFIARSDAPGPCPGAGWQAGPVGRRGEKGERGSQGMSGLRGDKGDPAREILDWKIDEKNYLLVPVMSDGSDGPSVSFLTLFKQFHTEAG
jgi:hypothetical protein